MFIFAEDKCYSRMVLDFCFVRKKIQTFFIGFAFSTCYLALSSHYLVAQSKVQRIDNFPISAAEVRSYITTIEVTDDGLIKHYSYVIQINNRDGDKYAEVSIPYQKKNKVYEVEANLFDKNGVEVRKLKKSEIVDISNLSDIHFFSDQYVKQFKIRHNEYPYTLKYSYKVKLLQYFYLAHWTPFLFRDIPTYNAQLTIVTPVDFKLLYKEKGIVQSSIDTVGNMIKYNWKSSYTKQIFRETFSPDIDDLVSWVKVFPETYSYEKAGSNKSWLDLGNWAQSLLEGLSDLPESEIEILKGKVSGIADEKEKIRVLFHYLQDATRYINVSIATGGYLPYPASYVAFNKYGDCKALANYFKVCLSHINIKAYFTLINAGEVISGFDEDFPSQQFNHAILYIPLKKDTLWVDCTSDLAFGYTGTFIQNRQTLVTEKNQSKLIFLPALSVADVLQSRKFNASISVNGDISLSGSCIYLGEKYEMLASLNAGLPEIKKRKYISDLFIEHGNTLEEYEIRQPNRDSSYIVLNYKAVGEKIKDYGNELLLKVNSLTIPIFELPSVRTLPVQINYPIYKVDTLVYTIPEAYKVLAMPENTRLETKYGTYSVQFVKKSNNVEIVKSFFLKPGYYLVSEYRDFFDFVNKVRENEMITYLTLSK